MGVFDNAKLNDEYAKVLKDENMCDTLFFRVRKK